jgi:hypothetical protein
MERGISACPSQRGIDTLGTCISWQWSKAKRLDVLHIRALFFHPIALRLTFILQLIRPAHGLFWNSHKKFLPIRGFVCCCLFALIRKYAWPPACNVPEISENQNQGSRSLPLAPWRSPFAKQYWACPPPSGAPTLHAE